MSDISMERNELYYFLWLAGGAIECNVMNYSTILIMTGIEYMKREIINICRVEKFRINFS